MTINVYLKVDVDTFLGMKRGVPRLAGLFGELGIKATFYLSFGPDCSGRALFNIWRQKGFLKKMLRTRAPALYGFRTMLYGTLLPPPLIAKRFPDLVRSLEEAGHEVGVHAWNHRLWQDHLHTLSREKIRRELGRACEAYESLLGHPPRSTAAPAWCCNVDSLSVQDELGLDYSSDSRGDFPFYPEMDGKRFRTMQIPTTLTCLEEVYGLEGERLEDLYLNSELREDRCNVFPVHAEVEGNVHYALFEDRLKETLNQGVRYGPLRNLCAEVKDREPRVFEVRLGEIPGRAGKVAIQETRDSFHETR